MNQSSGCESVRISITLCLFPVTCSFGLFHCLSVAQSKYEGCHHFFFKNSPGFLERNAFPNILTLSWTLNSIQKKNGKFQCCQVKIIFLILHAIAIWKNKQKKNVISHIFHKSWVCKTLKCKITTLGISIYWIYRYNIYRNTWKDHQYIFLSCTPSLMAHSCVLFVLQQFIFYVYCIFFLWICWLSLCYSHYYSKLLESELWIVFK